MEDHFDAGVTEYEAKVSPGFVTVQLQLVAVNANVPARNFRLAVEDRSEITGMLFEGFRNACKPPVNTAATPNASFPSSSKTIPKLSSGSGPTSRDIRIYYKSGSVDREYEPDFIVETKSGKWICETKKASDISDAEVQAKAQAAALWCRHATRQPERTGATY